MSIAAACGSASLCTIKSDQAKPCAALAKGVFYSGDHKRPFKLDSFRLSKRTHNKIVYVAQWTELRETKQPTTQFSLPQQLGAAYDQENWTRTFSFQTETER